MVDMNEFLCRTKVISGTRYRIEWFAISDGSLQMSTWCDTKEETDKYVERMSLGLEKKYTVKVTPEPWTDTICIECGR